MTAPYALLDFGNGRKLERQGGVVLDRPSPAALAARPRTPPLWATAEARFDRTSREKGEWTGTARLPEDWRFDAGAFYLLLRPTPFGHVGVFPEQQENWRWIAERLRSYGPTAERRPRVLNLFAYTGGSTLAAASAGAEVVHLDAARNVVQWARRNAEASGLATAPIRWIVEDARRFVQRELRRGRRYDALILDPPSYGHGARGEAWRLDEHLAGLLSDCRRLLVDDPILVLLTCHSPSVGAEEAAAALRSVHAATRSNGGVHAERLRLCTADGRELDAGVAARWPAEPG